MSAFLHRRPRSARAGPARVLPIVAAALLIVPASVAGKSYDAWGAVVPEVGVNTAAAEGCPIESPDGLSLYIASNRAGGTATPDPNDIWVFHRESIDGPWGPAENLGQPVNSTFADFCPTPLRGKALLFVSTRPGGCGTGTGDIYLGRNNPTHGWSIQHLGCAADGSGPNFPGGEFGPSLVETAEGTFLFFSSDGFTPGGPQDIYMSRQLGDGSFAPATAVTELNSGASDFMPNVRKDGLEIVFNSNRAGGFGGQDVYTSTRASTADPWSAPVNLGPAINTAGNETRSSLSWDGARLHFGRDSEIYVSTR